MKQRSPYYREIYDKTKEKELNKTYEEGILLEKYGKPYTKEDIKLKKLHAHNRGLRKMVKHFLSHYWQAARELKNLEITEPYIGKGSIKHNITTWKDILNKQK